MPPLMSVPTPIDNALNAITMSACGYSSSNDMGPSESLQEDAVISRLRNNTTAVFGLILARILFDCQNSFGYFKIAPRRSTVSHRNLQNTGVKRYSIAAQVAINRCCMLLYLGLE
jgi:hypothetical protein